MKSTNTQKPTSWHKIIGEFSWKRLVDTLILTYVILLGIVFFSAERLIFPYSKTSYNTKIEGLEFIKSQDGTKVATRFWRGKEDSQVILFFHGNLEDIGHLDVTASELKLRGFSVLAMDYRGYGLSEGNATEEACLQDSLAFVKHAEKMGFTKQQMIIWGRSVGSGVAVNLATQGEFAGLVLESPFVSTLRVETTIPLFPFDYFNSLSKISKVTEPLFILHGANDRVISPWHSEKLFERHQGQKVRHLIPKAGHNDIWFYIANQLDLLPDFFSNISSQSMNQEDRLRQMYKRPE